MPIPHISQSRTMKFSPEPSFVPFNRSLLLTSHLVKTKMKQPKDRERINVKTLVPHLKHVKDLTGNSNKYTYLLVKTLRLREHALCFIISSPARATFNVVYNHFSYTYISIICFIKYKLYSILSTLLFKLCYYNYLTILWNNFDGYKVLNETNVWFISPFSFWTF